jgi:hypothetical protein
MRSALVVLFNIDYSVNIPKLNDIYGNRFSRIFYIAPDHFSRLDTSYRDHQTNILIPYAIDRIVSAVRRVGLRVNENEIDKKQLDHTKTKLLRAVGHKYYFYHFIVQIQKRLDLQELDWVWFVSDDVLLNWWFDDSRIASRIQLGENNDCVMCRPKVMTHHWVTKFEGSTAKFEQDLAACIPYAEFTKLVQNKRTLLGNDRDHLILGGCSDFFGVRPSLLAKLIPVWKKMFNRKMFVELAIPHSLLAMSEKPMMTDDYLWSFDNERDQPETMIRKLRQHKQWLFVHPVKLFNIESSSLNELTNN